MSVAPRRAASAKGEDRDDLILDPKAPFPSARAFLELNYTRNGIPILRHHGGAFWAWAGTHYPAADESALRADLYYFLESAIRPGKTRAPFQPNRAKVGDVLDALRAAAHLSSNIRAPAWLGEQPADLPANEIIACANGLLHLPTLKRLPHTPEFFTLNALPFDFDPQAGEPTEFLKFLGTLWEQDREAINTLQEIFGYCLVADTRQQKLFLLVGPPRSGKGTLARILAALLGVENVAGPTLSSLAGNFGLSPLIGKSLAIISDARLGARTDQSAIAERLLSISGEDALTIDRKYTSAWTGRLATRFLILSNELPRIGDTSGALASRFIVLTLRESFYGREDVELAERLGAELPSILNWSIEGWRRLTARGRFVQPESSTGAIRELEDLGSPVGAFLRDRCIVAAGQEIEVGRLFEAWCAWCRQQGRDHSGSAQSFGRDLRAAVPALDTVQHRDLGGRLRYFLGVGLQ